MSNVKIPYLILGFIAALSLTAVLTSVTNPTYFSSVLSSWDSKGEQTIILTGDVMLGRSVNSRLSRTRDYSWPFAYIQTVLEYADLTYINLESPLIASCPVTESGMRLCGHSSNVQSLLSAGVDIASLANNHALDYGQVGLKDTIDTLVSNNIDPIGVGSIVVKDADGTKVAFVSFNDVGNLPGIDNALQSIMSDRLSDATSQADFVIATFHWGREYEASPTRRQVDLARQAVDLGADLVVGAHPHWIQSKDTYKRVPIYYSLGNTIFDQEWSEQTKTGIVLKVYIQDSSIKKIDELVLYSSNYGQPRWVTSETKE